MAALDDRGPSLVDREWLGQLRTTLTAADGLVLCLDFDGTLAPIVADPEDASITSGNRDLIRRLATTGNIRVGIVSGRSLDDLRERVGVDDIFYAGNHGMEWDDGTGRTVAPAARDARSSLSDVLDELQPRLASVPGCTVEDKDLTATVHCRRVADTQVPEVVRAVEESLQSRSDLSCHTGKEILEIRPDVSMGKDRPVEYLCENHPNRVGIFIGDDVTDEDGFEAVEDDGGYGVLVGDREDTVASARVPDPTGVMMLLAWFAHIDIGPD